MSDQEQFIGRGERYARYLLTRLLPSRSRYAAQVNIKRLISPEQFDLLDPIYQKHKFDFVFWMRGCIIAIEVNYKHGEGAAKKWSNIFVPLLKEQNIIPMTIDDYNCRSLFSLNSNNEHVLSWDDFRDIIDALEQVGVKP